MYDRLAPVYEWIFPLNEVAFQYLDRKLKPAPANVLDVGCGTGSMVRALVGTGRNVTGADPSPDMIREANRIADPNEGARWIPGGMLDVGSGPLKGPWDAILCLGNTLPHLSEIALIERFVQQCFQALHTSGMLVIQTVNFSRFEAEGEYTFPPLNRNGFQLFRRYEKAESPDRINFRTRLEGPEGLLIEGTEALYPVSADELTTLMEKTGFREIHLSGSFKGDNAAPDSPALIVRGVK